MGQWSFCTVVWIVELFPGIFSIVLIITKCATCGCKSDSINLRDDSESNPEIRFLESQYDDPS